MSGLEAELALMLEARGLPAPVREYRFDPQRRWRFDFAWPDRMLAVEIEGGTWSAGRHTRGSGYEADLEKYNAAALSGWTVLRFSGGQVHDGRAVKLIEAALHMSVVGSSGSVNEVSVLLPTAEDAAAQPGSSWEETKMIHGHLYRYRRWREGGRLRSQYLGRVE